MLKAEVDILTKCDHPNMCACAQTRGEASAPCRAAAHARQHTLSAADGSRAPHVSVRPLFAARALGSVKMYKCYETDNILYLVLELLTGGELFDTIIAKGHYSEADARQVAITMLDAIKYLHTQGVAHRDLKPENILLKDKGTSAIKITDFGLSKIFADDAAGEVTMKTACGTPGYVAPEVLGHEAYSSQVDLWSVGVIVYILLCGFPPFYGDNDAMMFKRIKAGTYKFLSPYA